MVTGTSVGLSQKNTMDRSSRCLEAGGRPRSIATRLDMFPQNTTKYWASLKLYQYQCGRIYVLYFTLPASFWKGSLYQGRWDSTHRSWNQTLLKLEPEARRTVRAACVSVGTGLWIYIYIIIYIYIYLYLDLRLGSRYFWRNPLQYTRKLSKIGKK